MQKYLLRIFLILGGFLASSQDLISVRPDLDYLRVNETYLLSDPTNSLTIEQIANVPISKWEKGVLATYSRNFEWILLPFINNTDHAIQRVFYMSNSISHKVDIYFVQDGVLIDKHIASGLARSSSNKLYNDPGYPYLIEFPANTQLFILLKVHDPLSSIQVPVHLLSLQKAYAYKDQNLTLLFFWMGIVTLSLVLAILMYFNTSHLMFFYYVMFALATAVIISSTTGMITMFIDADPHQIVTNYYQWGAVMLIVFMPRFINSLVPIFSQNVRIWHIIRTLGYVGIGIAILYSIPYFKFSFFFTRLFINTVVSLTAVVFLYILVSLLIASIRRKPKAFILFVIYFIYLSLGFVNVILPLFGAKEGTLNAVHFVLIGSVLEIFAFMIFMGQAAFSVYLERQLLLEQVRENQELVMQALVKGQEDERNRFARDLHDGFGQMISALNLNLKGLKSVRSTEIENRMDIFNASSDILKNMHEELKNICFDLMPQTLIKHGLEAALQEFTHRINASGQKTVEVHVHELKNRLTELQEISIYRITQEWVNNVLKYSDANHLTIQITRDDTELTLVIEDDGMGFDKSLLIIGKGNGWKNLNSRANLISGEIEIDTTLGLKGNTFVLNALIGEDPKKRKAYLEAQTKAEA